MMNVFACTNEILRFIESSTEKQDLMMTWGAVTDHVASIDKNTFFDLMHACNANGYLLHFVDDGPTFCVAGLTEKGRLRIRPHRWTRIEKTMFCIETLIGLVCTLFD